MPNSENLTSSYVEQIELEKKQTRVAERQEQRKSTLPYARPAQLGTQETLARLESAKKEPTPKPAEPATAQPDMSQYVKLDSGEYVNKYTVINPDGSRNIGFDDLTREQQIELNKLGIEGFNRSLSTKQAGMQKIADAEIARAQQAFELANIKLPSGEWINRDAYNNLPPEQKTLLNTLGIDNFISKMRSSPPPRALPNNITEQQYIQLASNLSSLKTAYNNITDVYQKEAMKQRIASLENMTNYLHSYQYDYFGKDFGVAPTSDDIKGVISGTQDWQFILSTTKGGIDIAEALRRGATDEELKSIGVTAEQLQSLKVSPTAFVPITAYESAFNKLVNEKGLVKNLSGTWDLVPGAITTGIAAGTITLAELKDLGLSQADINNLYYATPGFNTVTPITQLVAPEPPDLVALKAQWVAEGKMTADQELQWSGNPENPEEVLISVLYPGQPIKVGGHEVIEELIPYSNSTFTQINAPQYLIDKGVTADSMRTVESFYIKQGIEQPKIDEIMAQTLDYTYSIKALEPYKGDIAQYLRDNPNGQTTLASVGYKPEDIAEAQGVADLIPYYDDFVDAYVAQRGGYGGDGESDLIREAQGAYTDKYGAPMVVADTVTTILSTLGIMNKPQSPSMLWRELSPWKEEKGETFTSALKRLVTDPFTRKQYEYWETPEGQAELAVKYNEQESLLGSIFGNSFARGTGAGIMYDEETGHYRIVMGGFVPITAKPAVEAKTPGLARLAELPGAEEIGFSASKYKDFLRLRVEIPGLTPKQFNELETKKLQAIIERSRALMSDAEILEKAKAPVTQADITKWASNPSTRSFWSPDEIRQIVGTATPTLTYAPMPRITQRPYVRGVNATIIEELANIRKTTAPNIKALADELIKTGSITLVTPPSTLGVNPTMLVLVMGNAIADTASAVEAISQTAASQSFMTQQIPQIKTMPLPASKSIVDAQTIGQTTGMTQAQARAVAQAIAQATGMTSAQSQATAQAIAQSTGMTLAQAQSLAQAVAQATGMTQTQAQAAAQAIAQATGMTQAQAQAAAQAIAQATSISKAETSTSTATLAETEAMPYPMPQPLTQPMPQPLGIPVGTAQAVTMDITTAVDTTQPVKPIRPEIRKPFDKNKPPVKEKPKPKFPPSGDSDEDEELQRKREEYKGAITWKQGIVFHSWKYPYGDDDFATFYKYPPPGAIIIPGAKTAQETVQLYLGDTPPPPDRVIHMGIMDIRISSTPDGQLNIDYTEDAAKARGGDQWFGSSDKKGAHSHRKKEADVATADDSFWSGSV